MEASFWTADEEEVALMSGSLFEGPILQSVRVYGREKLKRDERRMN
jgi:hypothetical protein